MGDDTPLAVLSGGYRGLHHYFRQQFSQVTNPPIDSLRESRVMSLNTRLGNLTNVLDADASQTDILLLSSPVLTNAGFAAMRAAMGDSAADIDCGFEIDAGDEALRDAIARIRREAEDAVRGGSVHLVLDDRSVVAGRAAIPMILAAGAVHAHLVRNDLRTYTSINVRAAECLDVHYFAVLIGVGATTVNAYLAEDTIAERHRRGLCAGIALKDCVARYKRAVDQGLLKVMSKMGISVVSSYRGGYNFEAIGLSRTLVADILPGMPSRISGIGPRRHPAQGSRPPRPGLRHAGRWRQDRGAAGRWALPLSRAGRGARLRARADPRAAECGGERFLSALQEIQRGDARAAAREPARSFGHSRARRAGPPRRGRIDHRHPQALHVGQHVARRALGRGPRDARHRHEPHGRHVMLWRGRRGPRALPPAARRRQPQLFGQADRLCALRRHGPNTSTGAPRSRSRSPRAPSPARAASCPDSR